MATELSIRLERELSFDERSQYCKGFDYLSTLSGTIGGVASSCSAVPALAVPGAAVAVVANLFSGGINIAKTTMDCDSLPFEEIKDILNTKFNEIDRKLDQNTEALKHVHEKVTRMLSAVEDMRLEMKHQFKEVLDSIKNAEVSPLINKINNFVDSFDMEKKILGILKKDQYVNKLEEQGYLEAFRATKTPLTDGLSENIYLIISGNYAVPQNKEDYLALSALRALYYGTEAFIEVMYFLTEKYTYLVDYYYQEKNFEKYNFYFDSILNNFNTFKTYLVGVENTEGLIPKVVSVIEKAVSGIYVDANTINELEKYAKYLKDFQNEIDNMNLSVLEEKPETVQRIEFKRKIPLHGNWLKAKTVRYAVQYEKNNMYSKISDWSRPFQLTTRANPMLKGLPKAINKAKRLIFRQINDDTPQLVGTISANKIKFTDIDRDFYDCAGNVNEDMNEAEMLIINSVNITAVFEGGRRAIHNAAQSNNKNIGFEWIINRDWETKYMKDQRGYAAIHIAIESQSEEFFSMLLSEEADVNAVTNSGLTPLHLAVKLGYTNFVKELLNIPEVDVNKKDHNGFTALHFAIPNHKKRDGMIEILLSSAKVKVDEKNNLNLTPFHLAVMMDYDDKFQGRINTLLRGRKVNVNEGNGEKMTALHIACVGEKGLKKIKFLLTLPGIDVNVQANNNKFTPLHLALSLRKYDIVSELLKFQNTNINLPDSNGVTPLIAAVATGNAKIVKALLDKGAKTNIVTKEGFKLLHTAALRGDKTLFSHLLSKKLDINAKSLNGETPLHLAISRNFTEMAKFLLQNEANIDVKSKDGTTPMHLAAVKGNVELLEALLERNADINAKSGSGRTPLHLASLEGNLKAVEYLIEKKADVNISDKNHYTPLTCAVLKGHVNVVKYFLDTKKIKLNDLDTEDTLKAHKPKKYWLMCFAIENRQLEIVKYFIGTLNIIACNPIYKAATKGQISMVKYMVEQGNLDVNSVYDGEEFQLPIVGAILNRNLEIVKYLVSKGADVNHSIMIFKYALESKDINIVEYLVANGVDLKARFAHDYTYGFAAADYCLECLKYLAERNLIDVNAQNDEGDTILHKHVLIGNTAVVNYLCSFGADTTIKNNKKETAYDIAKKVNKADMYSCLRPKKYFKRSNSLIMENNNNDWLSTKEFENNKDQHQKYNNSYGSIADTNESVSSRDQNLLLKVGESTGSMFHNDYLNQPLNINSALMLMDVLLKPAKRQKHKFAGVSMSDADARGLALKVTEKFETLLNSLNNGPADEEIDLLKVHSDVFKTVRSERFSEIPNILESNLKSENVANNMQIDELLDEVFLTHKMFHK